MPETVSRIWCLVSVDFGNWPELTQITSQWDPLPVTFYLSTFINLFTNFLLYIFTYLLIYSIMYLLTCRLIHLLLWWENFILCKGRFDIEGCILWKLIMGVSMQWRYDALWDGRESLFCMGGISRESNTHTSIHTLLKFNPFLALQQSHRSRLLHSASGRVCCIVWVGMWRLGVCGMALCIANTDGVFITEMSEECKYSIRWLQRLSHVLCFEKKQNDCTMKSSFLIWSIGCVQAHAWIVTRLCKMCCA